jgi:hypothetical protein
MRSDRLAVSLSVPVAKRVRQQALKKHVSLSRFMANIIECHLESAEQEDEDCPCFQKSDLDEILEEAEDLRNCKVFATIEDLIKSDNEVINEIRKNKSLR